MGYAHRTLWIAALCAGVLIAGCHRDSAPPGRRITQAWADESTAQTEAQAIEADPQTESAVRDADLPGSGGVLAYVDGRPIRRSHIVDILLAGHGVGLLEQFVVLERARAMATEQNLVITQADIDAEHDRALRTLLSPLESADETRFNRQGAQELLTAVLGGRNISRTEYRLGMRRNAYLRAIVEANTRFTQEQLQKEYQRSCARRVQIRHVQLASFREAQRIVEEFEPGSDFAALARRTSANLRTAPSGGLLRPFSKNDEDVPAALRNAAFQLPQGKLSEPIRVDDWYHVVMLERLIPASGESFESVRAELEIRLRDRFTEPAMQTLYRTLFQQADIHVIDPIVAEQFAVKHPDRGNR